MKIEVKGGWWAEQGRWRGALSFMARKADFILSITENNWQVFNSIVLHYLFREDLLNCWAENGLQEVGAHVATGRCIKRTSQELFTGDGDLTYGGSS